MAMHFSGYETLNGNTLKMNTQSYNQQVILTRKYVKEYFVALRNVQSVEYHSMHSEMWNNKELMYYDGY